MYQINAAIIGMGFIGKLHYDALRRVPGVHIRTLWCTGRRKSRSSGNTLTRIT